MSAVVAKSPQAVTVDQAYRRLHITPLDAELLTIVLPASMLPRARNISFHTLESLPERRYGFVDLPVADADRLHRRLNGSVLKGCKMRTDAARASDMPRPAGDAALAAENKAKKKRDTAADVTTKKRKHDAEDISGAEIGEGRQVKRGWTTPEDRTSRKGERWDKRKENLTDRRKEKEKHKKEVKSQYTEGPECLFKTVLPPNGAVAGDKDGENGSKKKRKKHRSREVLVHEFENTTKFPTFLKSSTSEGSFQKATAFVEGKGWVDEDGNIVEAIKQNSKPGRKSNSTRKPQERDEENVAPRRQASALENEDRDGSKELPEPSANSDQHDIIFSVPAKHTAKISVTRPVSILKSSPARPKSSGSAKSLTIKIPPPLSTPAATLADGSTGTTQVHPLEALYKRPQNADGTPAVNGTEISQRKQGFSFFDPDNMDVDAFDNDDNPPDRIMANLLVPMTPYTRADFEWRGQRSAAPTPDTAFANRSFRFWGGDEDDRDAVEEEREPSENNEQRLRSAEDDLTLQAATDADEELGHGIGAAAPPGKDSQMWFWEHRGDLNRSWRNRRKMAAKEKRYRDNRTRAERAN